MSSLTPRIVIFRPGYSGKCVFSAPVAAPHLLMGPHAPAAYKMSTPGPLPAYPEPGKIAMIMRFRSEPMWLATDWILYEGPGRSNVKNRITGYCLLEVVQRQGVYALRIRPELASQIGGNGLVA